jgi:hypothetical protein
VWVADGLDLGNPDHIVDMLQHNYGGTRGDEWAVEVVAAPDPRQIRAEQGGSVPGFEPFFKE